MYCFWLFYIYNALCPDAHKDPIMLTIKLKFTKNGLNNNNKKDAVGRGED